MDEFLAAHSPDTLFRIQYAGSSTPIYLLCEHQSRSNQRMAYRMLRYTLLLLARDQEEQPDAMELPLAAAAQEVIEHGGEDGPRSVPDSYHLERVPKPTAGGDAGVGDARNTGSIPPLPSLASPPSLRFWDPLLAAEITELVKPLAPEFSGALNELRGEGIDELRRRGLAPQAMLSIWCLGSTRRLADARSEDEVIEILRGASEVMAQVLATPPGREAIGLVWRYVLELTEIPLHRLRALLEVELSLRVLEEFMTTAEQIRHEAWDRGQRSMLLRLITRRFGPVPEEVERRVYFAPRTWLDTWAERMFTARILGEVFKDEDFADE